MDIVQADAQELFVAVAPQDVEMILEVIALLKQRIQLCQHHIPGFDSLGVAAGDQAVQQFRVADQDLGQKFRHAEQGHQQLDGFPVFGQQGIVG